MTPLQYFNKSSLVSNFPDEFYRAESNSLRLVDGRSFEGKGSGIEILASTFGLVSILLRQKPNANAEEESPFTLLKDYLNSLDLSVIRGGGDGGDIQHAGRPRSARRLAMPMSSPQRNETSSVPMTPPNSDVKTGVSISPNMKEISECPDLDTPEKSFLIKRRSDRVIKDINDVCEYHRESLSTVLSYMCAFGDPNATSILNEVAVKKGVKRSVEDLVGEGTFAKYVESLRVRDWILLYFKTKARISGRTWQAVINITRLGRTGKSSDTPVLLNLNQMKAIKRTIFGVCREYVGVEKVVLPLRGFRVDLMAVTELIVREQRLHKVSSPTLQLMIKIDGRPFWGRDQVLIGIVPRSCPVYSQQSAKSVYPLAIANCKENRENLKILLRDVNLQKKVLKQEGIFVDGEHHSVEFVVTLDYKTLLLLLVKKDDDEFVFGGRGVNVEFCFICNAIRGCSCHNVAPDETCMDCLRSKSNIGRSSGIRDDLVFLLDEELSSIQLCSLHMEMRNTEQLLASVGLLAYKIDSLPEANRALRQYGPDSFHGDRITVKKKSDQQSAVGKHNIHVSSMSGPTELEILQHLDEIVEIALPLDKLKKQYSDVNTAKNLILNRVTFCQSRVDYFVDALNSGNFLRDFGTSTEVIKLEESDVKIDMEVRVSEWEKELDELSVHFGKLCKCRKKSLSAEDDTLVSYVANKQLEMVKRVCREWKEIAFVTRYKVFKETEQGEIDLFDIKCKEWGFLLKELFGSSLGTGDYGHLTIDHAPMLMRRFLSMTEFSQQGFEASHKDQRQLWLKASSHDQHGEATSIEQMLVHFYAEKMLFFRYCLREAVKLLQGKTQEQQDVFHFYFRGCGWKPKEVLWDLADQRWIRLMAKLMSLMFGEDFLEYSFDKKLTCYVHEDFQPQFVYRREEWISDYDDIICSDGMVIPTSPATQDVSFLSTDSMHIPDDKDTAVVGGSRDPVDDTKTSGDQSLANVPANQDSVIAVFPPPPAIAKITILQMDLDTLDDGVELNDSIVDFFMLYIAHTMDQEQLKRSHIFSSFFYSRLSRTVKKGNNFVLPSDNERYQAASTFTRRIDIFNKKFIFVPVCRSGHWFLALVYNLPSLVEQGMMDSDLSAPIIMIDSIVYGSNKFNSPPSSRELEAELIRSFIRCEWMAKKGTGTADTSSAPEFSLKSMPLFYPKVPQQENGYDCGIFVLLFIEAFLHQKFSVKDLLSDNKILNWYDQSAALPLRRRIAHLLLEIGHQT